MTASSTRFNFLIGLRMFSLAATGNNEQANKHLLPADSTICQQNAFMTNYSKKKKKARERSKSTMR